VAPELRWRRWRWDVGEDDVEIRSGTFTVTHTVVPLRRVQHVDTHQGLLEQALGLATVALHTAAGTNRIPALQESDAASVRDRIAALTRTADEL
jgi:membrane protein YdbS with pleckstrin-like domain